MAKHVSTYRVDYSILRIAATVAVVFLHTCNSLTDNPGTFVLNKNQLIFFTIGHNSMNWAVPTFIMLTGALLLKREKEITVERCLKKYALRILYALFLFGVPFSVIEQFVSQRTIDLRMLWQGFVNVITGDSWGHLWYLYMLIGIYLVLPLIKAFTDHCTEWSLLYILSVLFFFECVVPLLNLLLGIKINFSIPLVPYALFYLLLGCFFDRYVKQRGGFLRFFSLLVLAAEVGIVIFSIHDYPVGKLLLPVFDVFLTIGIFWFVFQRDIRDPKMKKIVWNVDRLCFGVYLIHPFFINLLYKGAHIVPIGYRYYGIVTLGFFVGFVVLSFISSWLLNKIKLLNKYVL